MNTAPFILGSLVVTSLVACSPKTPAAPQQPEAEPAPVAEAEAEPAPTDPSDVHIEGDHLTIDQKIHFALGSDEILDDSTDILDHIAQALGNHNEFSTLHVVGHTDTSGGHDKNQDLSERRAAAVAAALRERGVTQKVDARGVGETEPVCQEDTDDCHENNRRVEFIVK